MKDRADNEVGLRRRARRDGTHRALGLDRRCRSHRPKHSAESRSRTWPTSGRIASMATDQRDSRRNVVDPSPDQTNRRILAELQADARLTLAELGRRVGLSPPAVAERLQRLEADGVIRAYQ